MFRIPTDSEHVTLSENKWKIQNKWCHICLAPAPVILQFFVVVVVCTVLNVAASNSVAISRWRSLKHFCKEPTQNHLERIFRKIKMEVSVQNSLKPFPGEAELLYLTLVYHLYKELHKCPI